MTEFKAAELPNVALSLAALAADRQARLKTCSEELAETLKRHGCQLVAVPTLTPDGRIVAQVQLVDKGA